LKWDSERGYQEEKKEFGNQKEAKMNETYSEGISYTGPHSMIRVP